MSKRFKPDELAAMRAQLFRRASSSRPAAVDTDHVNRVERKRKIYTGNKREEEWTTYAVTLTVPWGGSRRYVVSAIGMSLAVTYAIDRDARMRACENGELALIGIKKLEASSIDPPLRPREIRLLLNTERDHGIPITR